MKILIVEDDHFYQKIYSHKFELLKYEVKVAGNGQLGLDTAKTFKPDIILLDIMMPVLDGFGMLEVLKKNPELEDIPVIMLTNLSTGGDADLALKKGAKACMVKSDVTPNDVVEKVKEILGK